MGAALRMMTTRIITAMMAITVLIASTNGARAITLAENGQPQAVIVIDNDAPDSVQLAAKELQQHIKIVTDAELPIQNQPSDDPALAAIVLGHSSYTQNLGIDTQDLPTDAFHIIAQDNALIIIGNDYQGRVITGMVNPWRYHEVYSPTLKIGAFGEAGTLNGVYEFLRRFCGIRWYMPGDIGLVAPHRDRLEIAPVKITQAPDFEYRYPWLCNFAETTDEPLWFRRVGFGADAPVQITHSFSHMLKYKDTHPEFFALIDGERDFTNLSTAYPIGNLCLSNPDLLQAWIDHICDYFAKNPHQKVYPVSPNDGMHRICDCSDCQAQIDHDAPRIGKFSNYVWGFVDRVARGVAKQYPDRYVGCIAYERYKAPPTNIEKFSPNVAVMLCKTRANYFDEELHRAENAKIAHWAQKAQTLYIWEYYLQSWRPWRNLPTPFPHNIANDLRHLKGISRGEFIESESWQRGDYPNKMNFPGMQHLNLYVTARVYWNVDLDVDALLAEYFQLFYGPAEKPMKDFWTNAERYWMTQDPAGSNSLTGGGGPDKVYTPQRIAKMSALLDAARQAAPQDSLYRQRVDLIAAEFAQGSKTLTNERIVTPPHSDIAYRGSAEIALDGMLDDPAWQQAEPLTFVSKEGNPPLYESTAQLLWDDQFLYIAWNNIEPEIDRLKAQATQRDQEVSPALWDEDGVEIFISPKPQARQPVYHFIINARGVVWDGKHQDTMWGDVDWNCDIQTAAIVGKDFWTLEIKIPLTQLDLEPPMTGRDIAINLYRNRICGGGAVHSCWSPTLDFQHFTPSRFGTMTLKK